jgi:membrane associated rhomboid family serine protease
MIMPVLFILVNLVICYFIGVLGRNRKLGFWGHFFGSLLLTPVIGFLLIVATDPVRDRGETKIVRGKTTIIKPQEGKNTA